MKELTHVSSTSTLARDYSRMPSPTIEELKKVLAFNDLPDDHLQWILDHSEYNEYEDGALIRKTGEEANAMIIILDGKVDFYMNVNGQLVYYYQFVNDETNGGVTGLLPYSRMKVYPGNSFAVGTVRGLLLHKEHFQELERLNPSLIQRLIGYMTERARYFATRQMQQEKVSALGMLSAGIAHELNNPASAINRISSELKKRLLLNYELTEHLLRHSIDAEHLGKLRGIVDARFLPGETRLSALQRIEREDSVSAWLENNGLSGNQQAVETFAESGFTGDDLEQMKGSVKKESFHHVLLWLENLLASQRLLKDLSEASSHISNLVGAIKSHVHMDRTNELQPTDLHRDIENALTLLGHKIRDKNIRVKKNFCEQLAPVPAYVGELNQVWTNIIDNAIYALATNGELVIETTCDQRNANVRIIDNGPGIPSHILSRIFDPFFTTKKVGEGTGIGLDIVKRIIKRHNGDIKVNSRPGRTEFTVCIPLTQPKDA
jgi:signal transduction histidine kinase